MLIKHVSLRLAGVLLPVAALAPRSIFKQHEYFIPAKRLARPRRQHFLSHLQRRMVVEESRASWGSKVTFFGWTREGRTWSRTLRF